MVYQVSVDADYQWCELAQLRHLLCELLGLKVMVLHPTWK